MRGARALRVFIVSAVVLLGVSAATCDTGSDTHPSAPQAPGPERGGPPVPPPRQVPSPQADPAPAKPSPSKSEKPMTDFKVTVSFDGVDRAVRVKWTVNGKSRTEVVKGT